MYDDSIQYSLVYVVKTNKRDTNDYLSVGAIFCFSLNEGLMGLLKNGDYHLCDGTELKIDDYPELFRVIGDSYQRPYYHDDSWIRKLLRDIGFNVPVKKVKNPNYREGYFKLPDLKGQFVLDPEQMRIKSKIIVE